MFFCFLAVVLIVFFTLFIYRNCRWLHRRFFLIASTSAALISGIYHTVYVNNPNVAKITRDVDVYCQLDLGCVPTLIRKILVPFSFSQQSFIRLIYTLVLHCFGEHAYLLGVFFLSVLNCILFLFSQFFFFKLLDVFMVSKYTDFLCCFVFYQPIVVLRCGSATANSSTVFCLVFFLYTIATTSSTLRIGLALFFLSLSHKIFFLPSAACLLYCLGRRHIRLTIVFLCVLCFNLCCVMSSPFPAYRCIGDTDIPNSHPLLRILNFSLLPLLVNCKEFFWGSELTLLPFWAYAVYVNILVISMDIYWIFLLKKLCKHINKTGRNMLIYAVICIILLHIEGIYLRNYMNANRHLTNVVVLWLFSILVLKSKIYLKKQT